MVTGVVLPLSRDTVVLSMLIPVTLVSNPVPAATTFTFTFPLTLLYPLRIAETFVEPSPAAVILAVLLLSFSMVATVASCTYHSMSSVESPDGSTYAVRTVEFLAASVLSSMVTFEGWMMIPVGILSAFTASPTMIVAVAWAVPFFAVIFVSPALTGVTSARLSWPLSFAIEEFSTVQTVPVASFMLLPYWS